MNEYTFDASITVLAESQPAAADLILTHCITGADIAVSLFTEGTLNLNTGASCTQRNEIARLTRELDEAKRRIKAAVAAYDKLMDEPWDSAIKNGAMDIAHHLTDALPAAPNEAGK